jgi:hypothetical protein
VYDEDLRGLKDKIIGVAVMPLKQVCRLFFHFSMCCVPSIAEQLMASQLLLVRTTEEGYRRSDLVVDAKRVGLRLTDVQIYISQAAAEGSDVVLWAVAVLLPLFGPSLL